MTSKSIIPHDHGLLQYTVAGSPVVVDTFKLVQDSVGVHTISAAIGEQAVLAVQGVFDAPKATGQAWVAGEKLYWHTANENFTNISTGATPRGFAWGDAVSGATEGRVRLTPGPIA